jgi:hypothetical protein
MPVRASLSTLKPGLLLGPAVEQTADPKDNGRVRGDPGCSELLARVRTVARLGLDQFILLVDLGSGRDTR